MDTTGRRAAFAKMQGAAHDRFCDQAHAPRRFRQSLGATPGRFRGGARGRGSDRLSRRTVR